MTARTKRIHVLSDRQAQVLSMLASKSQNQIAAELGCTRQNVHDVCLKLRELKLITNESKPTDHAVLAGVLWEVIIKMESLGPVVATRPEGA